MTPNTIHTTKESATLRASMSALTRDEALVLGIGDDLDERAQRDSF